MTSEWTPEAIRALGATTDVPTLGDIFGLGRWRSYQMARTGEWEQAGIRIIPIGVRYRVAVQSILDVLVIGGASGTDDDAEAGAELQEQAPGSSADGATADPPSRAVPQPASHRLRGLPSRAPRTGKARPRAIERGNTNE
jgi:hypothetical protein